MLRVTSLLPVSQTIDGVALGAFATQARGGVTTALSTAMAAAVAAKQVYCVDDTGGDDILTAASVLNRSANGKVFYLDSATEFATTLPAPELGLKMSFVIRTAPSGASYTVVTSGSANVMKGAILSADLNAASDGDIETAGGDTFSFVDSKAVAGDRADFYSDGTSWFVRAHTTVFDAATITTAS